MNTLFKRTIKVSFASILAIKGAELTRQYDLQTKFKSIYNSNTSQAESKELSEKE